MAKFIAYFLVLSLSMAFRVATCQPILACSETPYPQVCSSMVIGTSPRTGLAKTPSMFRSMVLEGAMDRAVQAHEVASAIDTSSLDAKQKAAWADCLKLSEDTVKQINRSMRSSSSIDDVQTWLSAAMADQETCRDGFDELGSTFPLGSPFSSYNITELLINLLAINEAMTPKKSGGSPRVFSSKFPKWMSAADRKLLDSSQTAAHLVVAKDGSGTYTTISEAIAAATNQNDGASRFVIHVKAGVYDETIEASMENLMLIGDGIGSTIITGSKNVGDGFTTFRSATFGVSGNGFIGRDMTFRNTAGPKKYQASAFRSSSDRSALYRCSFEGYQDTLNVVSQRQFYRECDIYGTVDFIFGDARAVFQHCSIYVRKPMRGQENTVTAHGRAHQHENTGIIVHKSVVTAAPDLKPVQGSFWTYLGRPWKRYSRAVFMETRLDGLIHPAGWLDWEGSTLASSTLYFGEYMNFGAGANTTSRVKWHGYRLITTESEALEFTVGSFLDGKSWIPATGVPFKSAL